MYEVLTKNERVVRLETILVKRSEYLTTLFGLSLSTFSDFSDFSDVSDEFEVSHAHLPLMADTIGHITKLCHIIGRGTRVAKPIRFHDQLFSQLPALSFLTKLRESEIIDILKGAHYLCLDTVVHVMSAYVACDIVSVVISIPPL